MRKQTFIQHILSGIIGAYLLAFCIGLWFHFEGDLAKIPPTLIFIAPIVFFYVLAEDSK